jgi:hypothetical protein
MAQLVKIENSIYKARQDTVMYTPRDAEHMLQPKPGRPDRLALDKGWMAQDKTIGVVGR